LCFRINGESRVFGSWANETNPRGGLPVGFLVVLYELLTGKTVVGTNNVALDAATSSQRLYRLFRP